MRLITSISAAVNGGVALAIDMYLVLLLTGAAHPIEGTSKWASVLLAVAAACAAAALARLQLHDLREGRF